MPRESRTLDDGHNKQSGNIVSAIRETAKPFTNAGVLWKYGKSDNKHARQKCNSRAMSTWFKVIPSKACEFRKVLKISRKQRFVHMILLKCPRWSLYHGLSGQSLMAYLDMDWRLPAS